VTGQEGLGYTNLRKRFHLRPKEAIADCIEGSHSIRIAAYYDAPTLLVHDYKCKDAIQCPEKLLNRNIQFTDLLIKLSENFTIGTGLGRDFVLGGEIPPVVDLTITDPG
jgi:hypothetical protein